MKIAYFDCFSGASGDMILGALIDCGMDLESLKSKLDDLGMAGFELKKERVLKKFIPATQADVVIDECAKVESRRLSDIKSMIENSRLSDEVKSCALRIFDRLGEAEALVHQVSIEDIHFHEVGAVDAIVDIVGSIIGLEMMGIERIYCSPPNVGGGFVKTAHGILPAPAPATLELMKGLPCYSSGMHGELLTPTGAAILSTVAYSFGPLPGMTINTIGYGSGKMELENPNVLRLIIGEAHNESQTEVSDQVAVIETNIDDMNPQIYDFLLEKALGLGALDVVMTSAQMKKNRPGGRLQIICPSSEIVKFSDLIFNETTSIGLRWRIENRIVAERSLDRVTTEFGVCRVKIAYRNGRTVNIAPEYEDCKQLALINNVPIKQVIMAVSQKASELLSRGRSDEN